MAHVALPFVSEKATSSKGAETTRSMLTLASRRTRLGDRGHRTQQRVDLHDRHAFVRPSVETIVTNCQNRCWQRHTVGAVALTFAAPA